MNKNTKILVALVVVGVLFLPFLGSQDATERAKYVKPKIELLEMDIHKYRIRLKPDTLKVLTVLATNSQRLRKVYTIRADLMDSFSDNPLDDIDDAVLYIDKTHCHDGYGNMAVFVPALNMYSLNRVYPHMLKKFGDVAANNLCRAGVKREAAIKTVEEVVHGGMPWDSHLSPTF